ncbi:Colicin-E2 immunity protein [compost metagenome]
MKLKQKLEDYTETEFLILLNEIFENPQHLKGDKQKKLVHMLIKQFEEITGNPAISGLIFYPEKDIEDSPTGVLGALKVWLKENGKPGFKP